MGEAGRSNSFIQQGHYRTFKFIAFFHVQTITEFKT